MISFNRKQTCSKNAMNFKRNDKKNVVYSLCDTDKTLRPKTIPNKLKFISSKTFCWSRDQTSIPLHTLAVYYVCVRVFNRKLLSLCDLMMPNTISRANQSNFYLVFDCLKIELGQFCHVINRCNFLESNCITITFDIQSVMRRHRFNAYTHTHLYNKNNAQ